MCQFDSQEDKTYKIFVANVRLILQGGEEYVENEHFIVSQLKNPNFTGRNDIRQELHKSLLMDRRMRKQNQDRFVLHGLGGSGKTQICVRFAHDHRNWYVFHVVDHFFSSILKKMFSCGTDYVAATETSFG